jgi:redox-sensitive bicupin YhaK (pirin superfamily)
MPIEELLRPRAKDLGGGFMVRRLLPAFPRQSVGPFVFFDHFGPVTANPGDDHDVRPHPHIGLATVTYLFEGAMQHRDSLGFSQRIEPGAINWMTAGSGIVHSERTPPDLREHAHVTHGLQLWAALPRAHEEAPAAFHHTEASAIPRHAVPGIALRVLIGEVAGNHSPVATFANTLYVDVEATPSATLVIDDSFGGPGCERALYSVDRALAVGGVEVPPHTLAVLAADAPARVVAPAGARYMIVGGAPLDGPRYIWWNYVASSKERIEHAKEAWRAQRMGTVPGETDFIPLPSK